MKFYRYDEHDQQFNLEYESVYDVTPQWTAAATIGFTNDFFVSRN